MRANNPQQMKAGPPTSHIGVCGSSLRSLLSRMRDRISFRFPRLRPACGRLCVKRHGRPPAPISHVGACGFLAFPYCKMSKNLIASTRGQHRPCAASAAANAPDPSTPPTSAQLRSTKNLLPGIAETLNPQPPPSIHPFRPASCIGWRVEFKNTGTGVNRMNETHEYYNTRNRHVCWT